MNDDTDLRDETTLTRRDSLLGLGGVAPAALGAGGVLAALDGDDAEAAASGPAAVASGLVTCVLTPEMTQGPYYLDGDKLRRDIREGRPGTRLDLATTVVDVSTCKPIKGAAVDIWHADAGGTYSGFAQEGTDGDTFMRGIQRTARTASRRSSRSTRAGTRGGRSTSTSRSHSAGTSCTPVSCSSPSR